MKAPIEPANDHRSHRRRTHRLRGLLGGGMLLSGLVALLVVAAPLTSAHGIVTYTAPFSGFTITPSNYTYHYGCGSDTQATAPSWNSSTGVFQVSSSASAGKCSYGFGEAYTTLEMGSPLFHAPYAGYGYVGVNVGASFSARAAEHLAAANSTSGNYSYASASVDLSVAVYIYDATHHNYSLFGYATYNLVSQSFTSTGSFSLVSGSQSATVYAYGTFTGGHVYQVLVYLTAEVFAYTYGGGSTAGASLDVAGSNDVTIGTITAY